MTAPCKLMWCEQIRPPHASRPAPIRAEHVLTRGRCVVSSLSLVSQEECEFLVVISVVIEVYFSNFRELVCVCRLI